MKVLGRLDGKALHVILVTVISLSLLAPERLRAVDCNGNGNEDAADIESDFSADCNSNQVPDECDTRPLTFETSDESLAVAKFPRFVRSADLNGDGDLDLITGNQSASGASTVSILLGAGDGAFLDAIDFDAGQRLASFTLADMDRDGDLDLVTANDTSARVLLNDGEAQFSAFTALTVAASAVFVAAADVNDDGHLDLVTAHSDADMISVRVQSGGGGFGPPAQLPTGDHPNSVAASDFDAGGDVDLAVCNRNTGTVSILPGRGDGTFEDAIEIETGTSRPFAVLAADLNGDGNVDLAVGSPTSTAVLAGQGGHAFSEPLRFDYVGAANSLISDDIDDDGSIDLIVGFKDIDKVTLIRNHLTTSFSFRAAVENQARMLKSSSVAAGDLNADGATDLALIAGSNVAIAWNIEGEIGSALFDDQAFLALGNPHTIALGDLDGDEDLDVVTGNHVAGTRISVLKNRGDGTFADIATYDTRGFSFSVEVADLDGDGDLDIASAYPESSAVQIINNDGQGVFAEGANQRVGGRPHDVAVGDLDGDRDIDVISANLSSNTVSLLFNRGDGTFETWIDLASGSAPVAAQLADLNGDGDLDIAVANSGSFDVWVFANRGDGSFAPGIPHDLVGGPTFVAVGDLDLDGHLDVVTANESAQTVSVLWNLGVAGEAPSFAVPVDIAVGANPHSVLTADLTGSGRLDVVTANQIHNTLSVLFNDGGRSFAPATSVPVGTQPRFAAAGDLDLDGDMDLISANRLSEDITVLLNRTAASGADYLERICTEADFYAISRSTSSGRVTKYILPAREDPDLLPTLYQNVRRFSLHEDFLAGAFPERFPTRPSGEEYDQLVGRRASRDYYIGVLSSWRTTDGLVYTFTVVADTGFDPAEVLMQDEISGVYDSLKQSFTLETLAYWPDDQLAREQADSWKVPDFPIFLPEESGRPGVDFEAYTLGTGYGRVRLFTLEEFEAASASGHFTFQDIVVVDAAPRDIEGIVAGVVTGAIQGPLSHVAIRTARRGTPNAFVEGALEEFAKYAGDLVRLDVTATGYSVVPAEIDEAEEFWRESRPDLPQLPDFDPDYARLDALAEIDLSGELNPVARFGGKATNLARLQSLLTGEFVRYREQGFAIPMHYYLEFMRTNRILVEGRGEMTFEQRLEELLAAIDFQSDSVLRAAALEEFRKTMRERGVVSPELVENLARRIETIFGSTQLMVRFRSSSNTEDALEFNGAGLYESTSVCAADSLDPARREGSHCDVSRSTERTIERALAKVWASLWTFRAHEERTFFQIPPERAAMGLLVTRAFLDEKANGVAFTGNPQNVRDRRYLITAQIGEESVVSPAPGTSVERNLLEVVEGGEVVRIIRDRRSSLVAVDEVVLSDEHLRELARLLWHVDQNFPLELEGHPREQVLLDFEFKIEPDDSLAVKQVRPFLIPDSAPPSPDFELVVPEGTEVCGVFSKERVGREPGVEYETKSTIRLLSGTYPLSSSADSFAAELIEEVRFGPEQAIATPEAPGLFRVARLGATGGETTYRFNYEQNFTLPGGESFVVKLFGLRFTGRGALAVEKSLVLDEDYLTFGLAMQGFLADEPVVGYSSCSHAVLPRWEIAVDFGADSQIRLVERFLPSELQISTGPASLRRAEVELEGQEQVVSDYWRLVYAARRHNVDVRYWVVLEPALRLPSLAAAVRVVEIAAPGMTHPTGTVSLLDESFQLLSQQNIASFVTRQIQEANFVRGDVDVDGELNLADALAILGHLFQRRAAPTCAKAADVNDDGRLNVSDAIVVLLRLFAGGSPLAEPSSCGTDATADALSCASYSGCE